MHAFDLMLTGEPDAGNLHVRFDEGRAGRAFGCRLALLLYCLCVGSSFATIYTFSDCEQESPLVLLRADG